MAMKVGKHNTVKLLIIGLWATSVCAAITACIALLSVLYVGTNDLPNSCKGWSVSSSISSSCKLDIASIDRRLCYDNSDYVSCEEVALAVLEGRRLLIISITVAILASVSALTITSRQPKPKKVSAK